ncbi:Dual specificity S/Y phosphatase [Acanthamoeba polyphaga moumouvirus]|uniref:Dual specificity S/Y phosphatase n=1 Tax=Acanthamoeba polyphaga moumouvirus TaxID=1269028 RepID=L7RCX5_9VIRU|nr:Dual specificity S/Y phosphatase [Acanthamoeba polyphaga moumouvirus]AGC02182.1 Dual specificity S/Y phosphatase [Acanthamoeba polyphaga moumouvirus]
MTTHSDLSKISKISNNIYLSGIFPMEEDYSQIKKLNIKYILSCVDRKYVSDVHDKIMSDNPDLTILYIPYNDDISQNLWEKNNSSINIVKYSASIEQFNSLLSQYTNYQHKPMIEIAYHFINKATTEGENILVHCMAGISRSVSMLTYYYMKKYNLTYDYVIQNIKTYRSIANPNDSFKAQLKYFYKKKDKFTESDAIKIINHLKYN